MMRAKMKVESVKDFGNNRQEVVMHPVCKNGTYGPNGEDEDNTFAMFSPSGELKLTITNPALAGSIKPGMTFYLDFTEHVA